MQQLRSDSIRWLDGGHLQQSSSKSNWTGSRANPGRSRGSNGAVGFNTAQHHTPMLHRRAGGTQSLLLSSALMPVSRGTLHSFVHPCSRSCPEQQQTTRCSSTTTTSSSSTSSDMEVLAPGPTSSTELGAPLDWTVEIGGWRVRTFTPEDIPQVRSKEVRNPLRTTLTEMCEGRDTC